ncbi:hypothetical protein F443_03194 [Phytophthora nicotianae P1569]|uniref:Uncharacterized protein n=1 Tax=Phytophthora nicotianae P1569 TaxID=1317065 RepID=V9FT86_PHYNI|nr:hypothetical protein F443_03194 [Phytophthora nicotianae P1569]
MESLSSLPATNTIGGTAILASKPRFEIHHAAAGATCCLAALQRLVRCKSPPKLQPVTMKRSLVKVPSQCDDEQRARVMLIAAWHSRVSEKVTTSPQRLRSTEVLTFAAQGTEVTNPSRCSMLGELLCSN